MKSFILVTLSALLLFSCAKEVSKEEPKPSKVYLKVENTGDGEERLHNHAGNEHKFVTANSDTIQIKAFKYYISNLMFVNTLTGDFYKVPNSYYLFGYENGTSLKPDGAVITGVPNGTYTHLTFGIGVDNAANLSTAKQGDLDPNSGMAWNWITGYKFLVIEGNYLYNLVSTSGIVFHIGRNENYKTQTFALPAQIKIENNSNITINLKSNASKAFSGLFTIARSGVNSVPGTVMGGLNATSIAGNYALGMFSITNVTY